MNDNNPTKSTQKSMFIRLSSDFQIIAFSNSVESNLHLSEKTIVGKHLDVFLDEIGVINKPHVSEYQSQKIGTPVQFSNTQFNWTVTPLNNQEWILFGEPSEKSAQEQLESHLLSFSSCMPGNFYWKDSNGYYLGCNENLLRMLNMHSLKEIIGKTDYDLWPNEATQLLQNDRIVMETDSPLYSEESIETPQGEKRFFAAVKIPLKNAHGTIIGVLGNSLDITELKKAKEIAETANEAKSEFLRNMRHDLRTPFTGIISLTEMMSHKETDPTKKEYLSMITTSGTSLLNQLNEILEFVNVEEGHLPLQERPFVLKKLLTELTNTYLATAQVKKLHFEQNYAQDLPETIVGDPLRTQQILISLLSNAMKFTTTGSIIFTVTVAKREASHIILQFVVQDTGPGIAEEQQALLFQRFGRLKASYRENEYTGKGFGLKIVRNFLDDLGGEVSLESKANQGTTVNVLIPYQLSLLDRPNTINHK